MKMLLILLLMTVVATACYVAYIRKSPDFQFEIVAGGWIFFLVAIFLLIMLILYQMTSE